MQQRAMSSLVFAVLLLSILATSILGHATDASQTNDGKKPNIVLIRKLNCSTITIAWLISLQSPTTKTSEPYNVDFFRKYTTA
jgi:hypothetical protein